MFRRAWDQHSDDDDHLLFGARRLNVDLSVFHPEPVQIFKLWQIYLDYINPMLKVTHTPTLQARIIDAASDIGSIDGNLEALMFGIYSMAVLSITQEDCRTMLKSPKEDLLVRYHFGCQQALINCGFLRSSDRDCLTAYLFYLVGVV